MNRNISRRTFVKVLVASSFTMIGGSLAFKMSLPPNFEYKRMDFLDYVNSPVSEGNSIRIGTLNVKNKYLISGYDGDSLTSELAKFISLNAVDIMGLQEVTPKFRDRFVQNYKGNVVGENRLPQNSLLYHNFSELNPIATSYEVLCHETVWLSNSPYESGSVDYFSILPRIATVALVNLPVLGFTIIINTQFDHLNDYTRACQAKCILEIVKTYNDLPIVLLGDFNLNFDNEVFLEFQKNLLEYGLKEAKYSGGSINDGRKIDHIFVPESWNIESTDVKDFSLSDHRLILTECILK